MPIWGVMFVAGALTYATRLSFILLLGRVEIPAWLRQAIHYVPPAVLSAIIFPEVVVPTGQIDISLAGGRFPAALLAILVAWRTRSALLTILAGMLALWLFRYFM